MWTTEAVLPTGDLKMLSALCVQGAAVLQCSMWRGVRSVWCSVWRATLVVVVRSSDS